MQDKLRTILADLRQQMQALYAERLAALLLYGSRARGDAASDSDIDVLVVLRGDVSPGLEVDRTLDIVTELSSSHDEVITCIFVSDHEFAQHDSPLLLNVRREGVPV